MGARGLIPVDMHAGSKDIVFDLDSIFFFVVRLHVYNVVGVVS